MTTTSPEPSPYAVQLDADEKHGILPFSNSTDPVQNYEYMREFITWLLANSQSKASLPLRVRAAKFYEKIEASQTNPSDLPSYDEYLGLVDDYNTEQGYTSPLRNHEPGSNARLEAKVDELLALLKNNPDASRRPGFIQRTSERFAAAKAAATSPTAHADQPTHPAPPSQTPTGPTRRRH